MDYNINLNKWHTKYICILGWIDKSLIDREQKILLEGYSSPQESINAGVIQKM